jgi:hypothetical protein
MKESKWSGNCVRALSLNPQYMQIRRVVIAMLAAGVWIHASAQNLILNGDFESPLIPANSIQHATPDSWTWESAVAFIFNGSYGPIWPLPESGQQFLDLGNETTFALLQSFTVSQAGQFRLDWFDNTAAVPGFNSPYSVNLLDGSLQPVFQANFDAAHGFTWQSNSILVSLSAGSHTLRLHAQGFFGGLDTLIDNVSITLVTLDSDGDGVLDERDQCPGTPAGAVVDEQGCSIDQLVPCSGPASGGAWRNHGEYVSAIAKTTEAFLSAGRITEEQAEAIVEAAAHSDCGKK